MTPTMICHSSIAKRETPRSCSLTLDHLCRAHVPGRRAPARRPASAAAASPSTIASRSSTTRLPISQSASCTSPARCGDSTAPGAVRIGCSGSSGSVREHVDRRAEATVEDELGQRVEVDDMGAADEDEHCIRLHELEQLAREKRAVLARRRREHEDDPRGLEELLAGLSARRARPLRYASVSHGSYAQSSQPNGSSSARKRRPMFPKPTKPTRLPVRRNVPSVSALLSQRSCPARTARSSATRSRLDASASASAISATASANAGAAESTRIPRSKQRA